MNGVINVLKPRGISSFGVVSTLRKLLNIRKIGHTGTLDPEVSGVLLICINKATKFIPYMMEYTKTYQAELTLGIETDTEDAWGNVINVQDVNVSEHDIINVFKRFKGKYMQIPPMYSALKINGEKLYDIARKGIVVDRKPREVFIYSLNIDKIEQNKIFFTTVCSKGTYIRTLCSDIGKALGCGGHMSSLIRTQVGPANIQTAYSIQQIKDAVEQGVINRIVMPVDGLLTELHCIGLRDENLFNFQNGKLIDIEKIKVINAEHNLKHEDSKYACGYKHILEPGNIVRVYDERNIFLGVGEIIINYDKIYLKTKRLF